MIFLKRFDKKHHTYYLLGLSQTQGKHCLSYFFFFIDLLFKYITPCLLLSNFNFTPGMTPEIFFALCTAYGFYG